MNYAALVLPLLIAACSAVPEEARDKLRGGAPAAEEGASNLTPPVPEPEPTPLADGNEARDIPLPAETSRIPEPADTEDVDRFVADYDQCQHWAGEEPYDRERRKQIEDGVNASCKGLDARLTKLRAKYRANDAVSQQLHEYDRVGM